MATKMKRPGSTPESAWGTRPRKASIEPPAAAQGGGEQVARKDAKPNLLRAGLKVLGNVRHDVVQHQSRIFEAILGFEPGAGWAHRAQRDASTADEAQGQRKFEAVFDQRVASTLDRLGVPSSDALATLAAEVTALRAEIAAIKTARGSAAPNTRAVPSKR